MLYIDEKDEADFIKMQKDLELTGELVESGNFHATVRYVKDEDYKPFIDYLKTIELLTVTGKCKNFAIYGENKDTLVDFSSIEKNLEHVNLVDLNIQPIPIEKIVKSVTAAVANNNQQKPHFGRIQGLQDENGTFFFIAK